jgi:hypothetical protein
LDGFSRRQSGSCGPLRAGLATAANHGALQRFSWLPLPHLFPIALLLHIISRLVVAARIGRLHFQKPLILLWGPSLDRHDLLLRLFDLWFSGSRNLSALIGKGSLTHPLGPSVGNRSSHFTGILRTRAGAHRASSLARCRLAPLRREKLPADRHHVQASSAWAGERTDRNSLPSVLPVTPGSPRA